MDDALAATSDGQVYLRASLDRQRLEVTHATSGRSFSFPVPSTAQAAAAERFLVGPPPDEVTALMLLPFRTAQGESSQCIAAGCRGGSLSFFNEQGTLLLSQASHGSAVRRLQYDAADDVLIALHARAVAILEGRPLLRALHAAAAAVACGEEARLPAEHRAWELPLLPGAADPTDVCVVRRAEPSPLEAAPPGQAAGEGAAPRRLLLSGCQQTRRTVHCSPAVENPL